MSKPLCDGQEGGKLMDRALQQKHVKIKKFGYRVRNQLMHRLHASNKTKYSVLQRSRWNW